MISCTIFLAAIHSSKCPNLVGVLLGLTRHSVCLNPTIHPTRIKPKVQPLINRIVYRISNPKKRTISSRDIRGCHFTGKPPTRSRTSQIEIHADTTYSLLYTRQLDQIQCMDRIYRSNALDWNLGFRFLPQIDACGRQASSMSDS